MSSLGRQRLEGSREDCLVINYLGMLSMEQFDGRILNEP